MKKICFIISILVFCLTINLHAEALNNELSLKNCVDLALKNNLDIKIEELNLPIAKSNIEIEKSSFDKNIVAGLNKSYSKSSSFSTLQRAAKLVQEGMGLSFGISQKLFSGTSYTLSFNTQQQESNSSTATLNPYYMSNVNLSLAYPLMKGKGKEITINRIKTAAIELEIANLQLQSRVIDTINLVEFAYFNLLLVKETVKVKEKILQSARDFENEITEKAKVGVLPKSDILQSQTKVASAEAGLIAAKADYQKAKDNLAILIYPENYSGDFKEIDTTDIFEEPSQKTNTEQEEKDAFLYRPDYNIMKKNLIIQEKNLIVLKNQKLPALDLTSDLGVQRTKKDIGDIQLPEDYNYQIGIQLKYPLENRGVKEAYSNGILQKEKSQLSIKNLENKIKKDVSSASRDVETTNERLKAEKRVMELSLQNLQQEKEKFRVGLSTTFNVLQYEDDYNSAIVQELKAIIDYNLAICNLSKVTGKNVLRYGGSK